MLLLIDVIADVFFRPIRGLQQAARFSAGKTTLFLAGLFLLIYWPLARIFWPNLTEKWLAALFALQFFFMVAVLLVFSFCLNGAASFLLGNMVETKRLFNGLVFSFVPFSLLPLFLYLPEGQEGLFSLSIFLVFWAVCLSLLTIKKLYGFSFLKACLLFSLPFLFCVGIFVLFSLYISTLCFAFFV